MLTANDTQTTMPRRTSAQAIIFEPVPRGKATHTSHEAKNMRFPWTKQQPDTEAIARSVARQVAEEVLNNAVETAVERVNNAAAMSPIPQIMPSANKGQHSLYQFDNPIVYSTPVPPTRRPGSIVTIQTLRQMADNYDVLRACIQHLKREVTAVPVAFVAVKDKDDRRKTKKAIDFANHFFSTPGGLGGPGQRRSHFENKIIEDLAVIGAAATWFNTSYAGGLVEALPIDASTIRPKVDAFGWPGPGEKVFEQWVWGVKVTEFSRAELSYDGVYPRSYTPYFASPVEWLLNVINSALRADDWNRRWLTDGTTVSDMLALPADWTPDQIKSFAEYYDAILAGDSSQRQKTRFVPGGSQKVSTASRKDQDFEQFELWLLRRTCAIMGVQPASIGFAGEQYKVSQNDSMESTSQFGAGTILEFRKAHYDDMLSRMGFDGLIQCENVTAREEKSLERANRNVALVAGGIKKINEARQDEGLDPDPDGNVLLVPITTRPLSQALAPPEPPPGNGDGSQNTKDDPALPGDGPATDTDTSDVTKRSHLAQWQRKAIRSLQRGQGASVPFESADIPAVTRTIIISELRQCQTPAEVKILFRAAHMPSVYLVRHAPTKLSGKDVIGWLNPGISGKGKDKAQEVAKWFVGRGVEQIKTSDLKRCVQTAKIISDKCGAPIIARDRAYRAWNLGEWEGQSSSAFRVIMDDYVKKRPDVSLTGGESFNDFANRFLPAIQAVLIDVRDGDPETTLVCTSSPCLKLAIAWLSGSPKADNIDPAKIDAETFIDTHIPEAGIVWIMQTDTGWSAKLIDVDAELDKK